MKWIGLAFIILMIGAVVYYVLSQPQPEVLSTGAPPVDYTLEKDVPDLGEYAWYRNWVRPDVPPTVGLQVGHWRNDEVPEELEKLKKNTGASGSDKMEWEVNFEIATRTKAILEEHGVRVDLLPTTVPPDYWADAFVAIHADGDEDSRVSGFKVAGPWRDWTGNGERLMWLIEKSYEEATGLEVDPEITSNMRGYYAFSWWRFDHSIHPMTTAAILETGFLTNADDREIIVDQPEISAAGLAEGIRAYLESEGLL